jgi:hypothetical protein
MAETDRGYEIIQNYYIQVMLNLADRTQCPVKTGWFSGFGKGTPAPATSNANIKLIDKCTYALSSLIHTLEDVTANLVGEFSNKEWAGKIENIKSYIACGRSYGSRPSSKFAAKTKAELINDIKNNLKNIIVLRPGKSIEQNEACRSLIRIFNWMQNSRHTLQYGNAIEQIEKYQKKEVSLPEIPYDMGYIQRELNRYSRAFDPSARYEVRAAADEASAQSIVGRVEALAAVEKEKFRQAANRMKQEGVLVGKILNSGPNAGGAATGTAGPPGTGQGGGRRYRKKTHRRSKKTTRRYRKSRRHY